MRLFFALWPDAGTRARLTQWARALRAACGGRAMRGEDLHVTLAFLGSVADARVDEVKRAADAAAPRAFSLVLDEAGYWKRNRIAWAGASSVPAELDAFVAELRGALKTADIAFDPKPFVSHVTLLRDAREPEALPVLPPIEWSVDGFALVRSLPSPRGSEYRIQKAWRV